MWPRVRGEQVSWMHEKIIFYVISRPAKLRNRFGVFESKCYSTMTTQDGSIRCDRTHCWTNCIENTLWVITLVVCDAMRRLGSECKNCRLIRGITFFHMVWCKWTLCLVFTDAVWIFCWIAKGAFIQIRRPATTTATKQEHGIQGAQETSIYK